MRIREIAKAVYGCVRAPVLLIVLMNHGILAQTPESSLTSTHEPCLMCHTAQAGNFIHDSQDVSPVGTWRSSMMAFAAKDPYWLAKVSAEVAARPSIKSVIEAECVTCHAPLGSVEAHDEGVPYAKADIRSDPKGADGGSCIACHKIQDENLGTRSAMSGGYTITKDPEVFGPYESPLQRPMWMHTRFVPTYSPHIEASALCASCHNLYTPIFDEDLKVIGEYPEQVPYSEWVVSDFPQQGVTCQSCHLDRVELETPISSHPPWLSSRKPVWDHRIVGGNTFMLSLIRDNVEELGISVPAEEIESTILKTREMLQNRTLRLDVDAVPATDSLDIVVTVTNLTGHKFPTAYPERRSWIHLTVRDSQEKILFESGRPDSIGRIAPSADKDYHPHHDVIRHTNEIQVYEIVPTDRSGNATRRLLSAAGAAKDNRILPRGFDPSRHELGVDVPVIGQAENDPNFDPETGSDRVTYRLARTDSERLQVTVDVYYQSIPPGAIDDLRPFRDEDVIAFIRMVDGMKDRSPEKIAFAELIVEL